MANAYTSHTFTRDQGDAQHLCANPQMTAENQHVFKWLSKYRMVYDVPSKTRTVQTTQK